MSGSRFDHRPPGVDFMEPDGSVRPGPFNVAYPYERRTHPPAVTHSHFPVPGRWDRQTHVLYFKFFEHPALKWFFLGGLSIASLFVAAVTVTIASRTDETAHKSFLLQQEQLRLERERTEIDRRILLSTQNSEMLLREINERQKKLEWIASSPNKYYKSGMVR
jgi:hypothetical protein